jgi:hypothetical protein
VTTLKPAGKGREVQVSIESVPLLARAQARTRRAGPPIMISRIGRKRLRHRPTPNARDTFSTCCGDRGMRADWFSGFAWRKGLRVAF